MSTYATPVDLAQLSINTSSLQSVTQADMQAALTSASNMADGYLATQFSMPIQPIPGYTGTGAAYSPELKQVVCDIAAYRLLRRRGFKPNGTDELIVDDYQAAVRWLRDVGAGKITPPGLVGSDGVTGDTSGGPMVTSDPLRGFQLDPPNENPNGALGESDSGWD